MMPLSLPSLNKEAVNTILWQLWVCGLHVHPVSVDPEAHLGAVDSSLLLRKCHVLYWMCPAEEVTYHPGLVMAELRHIVPLEQGGGRVRNEMTRCLWRNLIVARCLHRTLLPAGTISLDRTLPRLQHQEMAALVSDLLCDATVVATVNDNKWGASLKSKNKTNVASKYSDAYKLLIICSYYV